MTRLIRAFATGAGAAAVVASVLTGGLKASGYQVEPIAGQQAPAASVFTAQQATAGKVAYTRECASCHQPDLSGENEIPALAGVAFKAMWGTRSTKDLLDYMSAAMPYGRPSLSADAYTSILAYILQSNGAVAGTQSLSATTVVPIDSVTAARATPPALPAQPAP
jgi:mono/diheme cytochrome c family protein